MIAHPLYLPDYTLGHMMSHQIRSYMRGKDLAAETKRITSLGCLTPDLWMNRAVASPGVKRSWVQIPPARLGTTKRKAEGLPLRVLPESVRHGRFGSPPRSPTITAPR